MLFRNLKKIKRLPEINRINSHYNKMETNTKKEITTDGIFAINKPIGISSAQFLNKLNSTLSNSPIFKKIIDENLKNAIKNSKYKKLKSRQRNLLSKLKMGHGGTLDPLASGILVIGIGNGTKKLENELKNTKKIYNSIALLGSSTTTYDSEGKLVLKSNTKHITKELILNIMKNYKGEIKQTPPLYSALKLNGRPLYDYARNGEKLPKEIEPRLINILNFELYKKGFSFDHDFKHPIEKATEKEIEIDSALSSLYHHDITIDSNVINDDTKKLESDSENKRKAEDLENNSKKQKLDILTTTTTTTTANDNENKCNDPIIQFEVSVSSGTYIRSLIHDLGKDLKTSAHMVQLERSQQGPWKLGINVFELDDFKNDENIWFPVLEHVLKDGSKVDARKELKEKIDESKFKEESNKKLEESNEKSKNNE